MQGRCIAFGALGGPQRLQRRLRIAAAFALQERLGQHDVDQAIAVRKFGSVFERRNRFAWPPAFEQRLSLELPEIGILGLRLD